MTSRERIFNTIERKPVDRIPISFDITSPIVGKLAAHYNIAPHEIGAFIGDDLLFVGMNSFGKSVKHEGCDAYLSEFGAVWDYSSGRGVGDAGILLATPLAEPRIENYTFPDPMTKGRFDHFDSAALKQQPRFVIMGMTGLFDLCWFVRGFQNFLMDMAGDEAFAGELLDRMLAFNLDIIKQIPDCVDGIRFGEDWGLQKGLMMGAATWRKLLKPRLAAMYGAARKRGFKVFIHTCGDVSELFEDFIEIGVEVVNPVQPEAMDIEMLQRKFGSRITMYGGIGSQSVLVYGTPADVVAQAQSRLALFADGGYIMGPAGAISTDAKVENAIALVDFCRGL